MADNNIRAWTGVLTKGSASLKKRLTAKHGDKPEFQQLLKRTGQDKETWYLMHQKKQARLRGETPAATKKKREEIGLKAWGATKGTRMGGEEGGGLTTDAPKAGKAVVGQYRGAGPVKTLSVAEYMKQKEKEQRLEKAKAILSSRAKMNEEETKQINELLQKGQEKSAALKKAIANRKAKESAPKIEDKFKKGSMVRIDGSEKKYKIAGHKYSKKNNEHYVTFHNNKNVVSHKNIHRLSLAEKTVTSDNTGFRTMKEGYIKSANKKLKRATIGAMGSDVGKATGDTWQQKRDSLLRMARSKLKEESNQMDKEVEQIDELKKSTLSSYVGKARENLKKTVSKNRALASMRSTADVVKGSQQAGKRDKGISRAYAQLNKEEYADYIKDYGRSRGGRAKALAQHQADQERSKGDQSYKTQIHVDGRHYKAGDRAGGESGAQDAARHAANIAKKTGKKVSLHMIHNETGKTLSVADHTDGKWKYRSMAEALDKVGKETADIDNDKDVDKTDMYLHNKRYAIKKAISKKKLNEGKASAVADKAIKLQRGKGNKINRKPTMEVDMKAQASPPPTHDGEDNSANAKV